ncbi:MAG TPA: phosphoribosylglycinamide formyltransferase [Gammaproteobacteria bacterium]|nr:phosphoribosylglycinamide formyltransferase [Gammaproteobacteria bacterium]
MVSTAPRIVVLISGEGSNLQAIIDATNARRIAGTVALVVSNRSAARGLERARAAGIPAKYLGVQPGADRAAYDAALAELLAEHHPDVLVLAGFMRILGAELVARFAGRTLNIHPSLLPKYPGLDTHRRVLEAGDREHGATVHLVTNDLDMGPRVIQYRLAVRPDDTPESLQQRVHVGEHLILPRAVDWLATGRLKLGAGGIMLDSMALSEPITVEEENGSQ